MQRILVTGAAGQLGVDVVAAAAESGITALGVSRRELDVTDSARVTDIVSAFQPDAIIHCAAWTAVDDAEAQPEAARDVNEVGTRVIAQAADACGAHLVAVSTDYVFDGRAEAGYAENDPTAPINEYGRTKLLAERAAREVCSSVTVARTSWAFGCHGANFVRTILGLASTRDAIDVVSDQRGCPTWTRHLADALLAAAESRIQGTLHLVGSPACSWHDLAVAAVHEAGIDCDVRAVSSDRFPRPAPRPACSILRVTRPETPVVGDWHEGVAAVVSAMRDEGALVAPIS